MESTIQEAYKYFIQFCVGYYSDSKSTGIDSEHYTDALKAHYLYNILRRLKTDNNST